MGREGERKGEKHRCARDTKYIDQLPFACPQLGTWPTTQTCALTGNWTGNIFVCRPALNPLSHTSQGNINFLHSYLLKLVLVCIYSLYIDTMMLRLCLRSNGYYVILFKVQVEIAISFIYYYVTVLSQS